MSEQRSTGTASLNALSFAPPPNQVPTRTITTGANETFSAGLEGLGLLSHTAAVADRRPGRSARGKPRAGRGRPVKDRMIAGPLPDDIKIDPGGHVLWVKHLNNPWWPAKTLDPATDFSFPADGHPPRPSDIPVRLFGTYEFTWLGSKRNYAKWEEGCQQQYETQCALDAFKTAVQESRAYKSGGLLPDQFYMPVGAAPVRYQKSEKKPWSSGIGRPASRGRGSRSGPRSKAAAGVDNADKASPDADGVEAAGAANANKATEVLPEEMQQQKDQRKTQRLINLGLVSPPDSPFANGSIAPNPELLALMSHFEAEGRAL